MPNKNYQLVEEVATRQITMMSVKCISCGKTVLQLSYGFVRNCSKMAEIEATVAVREHKKKGECYD